MENWRADPQLTELWLQQMADFTTATTIRIAGDSAADKSIDPAALAATLTWLGERLYYLAAVGVAPFDDQDTLVDVLTHIWMSALYGGAESVRRPG